MLIGNVTVLRNSQWTGLRKMYVGVYTNFHLYLFKNLCVILQKLSSNQNLIFNPKYEFSK